MTNSPILIIDDDPMTRLMLETWCMQCGAVATSAASTAEADAALARQAFDVVLCDVHLPGNEKLSWVRALVARENAPAVVLITGNPEFETTLAAANLPVAGYLVKPLNLAALRQLIVRLNARRRHGRELRELARVTALHLTNSGDDTFSTHPELRQHLGRLAECLQAEFAPIGRMAPADANLRQSIIDTIAVLEKTKHSFRSKELGELRRRLQQTLAGSDTPS